jgi:hypothetical protein
MAATPARSAAGFLPESHSLKALRVAAAHCRGCDLYEYAAQTVFGEGRAHAAVMFVGEQPGDKEDKAGHPFVGPAGGVLDKALAAAGIARNDTYVTNAVKHFKFIQRGKARIHNEPKTSGRSPRRRRRARRDGRADAARTRLPLEEAPRRSVLFRPPSARRRDGASVVDLARARRRRSSRRDGKIHRRSQAHSKARALAAPHRELIALPTKCEQPVRLTSARCRSPAGMSSASPIVAPPIPCRPCGSGANAVHAFVAGSHASFSTYVPCGDSPPIT